MLRLVEALPVCFWLGRVTVLVIISVRGRRPRLPEERYILPQIHLLRRSWQWHYCQARLLASRRWLKWRAPRFVLPWTNDPALPRLPWLLRWIVSCRAVAGQTFWSIPWRCHWALVTPGATKGPL